MRADNDNAQRSERRLAYAGASVFALFMVAAVLLWLRDGEAVYVTRILSQIADCL